MDNPGLPWPRWGKWLWPILIGLAGFLVYAGSLSAGFVYDDLVDIRNVDAVFSPDGWKELLTTASARLYRPLKYLTLHWDYLIYGWKPFGFHLTNVLLHALNSVLVWHILKSLGFRERGALAGALVFAIHPIHTEVVAWVSSRGNLLAAAGSLGAILAYNKARQGSAWALPGVLFGAFVSIFSKEEALMLLPVLILLEWFWFQKGQWKALGHRPLWWSCLAVGSVAVIYMALRQNVLEGLEQGSWPAGLKGLLSTLPVIFVTYLSQLVYPLVLTVDQPVDYKAGFGMAFWVTSIFLIALALWLFIKAGKFPRLFFAMGWFFCFLFPALGLVPINQPMADRFLYLPSVALSMVLAMLWERLVDRQRLLTVVVTAWSLLLTWTTVTYTRVWKNEESLWTHTLKSNPESHRAWLNLAAISNNRGEFQKALNLADEGLKIYPNYAEGMIIKGFALERLGRLEEAEAWYRRGLSGNSENTAGLFLLADLLETRNRLEESEKIYEKIFQLRPGYVSARNSAGVLAMKMKKTDLAIEHWKQALRYDPNNATARRNLEVATRQRKQ